MNVGYVIASHEITKLGKPICYFYREEPIDENDSGWRFFSGDETQEYADNADNFSMYNATSIIEVEPKITEFLGLSSPVEIERDLITGNLEVIL